MKDYEKAYSEVCYILELLGDTFKTKIPNKLLKLIEYNKKKEFVFEEMINKDSGKVSVSEEAMEMLMYFNSNYWDEESKKETLSRIYEENSTATIGIEEPKKIEIEPDKYEDKKENKFLVVVDENSIIYKIKRCIRKIIGKWRDR